MKAVTIIAVILMVALVTLSEARHFGRRGNRKGHRRHDSDRPECEIRCPRPNRSSRVCAFNGDRNQTYPSACLVDKIACNKNITITIVAEGACPRPLASEMVGNGGALEESSSEEDSDSLESSEEEDAMTTTTLVPATSSEPLTGEGTTAPSVPTNPSILPTAPVTSASDPATATAAPGVTGPVTTCDDSSTCPLASTPVCGTDGATYVSACVLEAYACANNIEGLTVAFEGACPP